MNKTHFHNFFRLSKEKFPESASLIESIQQEFNILFESITPRQKIALKRYPIQFINKVYEKSGNWTSQLHIWALEGIKEILDLDPMILSYKNSHGDSVLMSFCRGATGALTSQTNYNLIRLMLSKDYSYTENSIDPETEKQKAVEKNAMEEKDIYGQTILDYLLDIAYAKGEYEDSFPDTELQLILEEFSENYDSDTENLMEVINQNFNPNELIDKAKQSFPETSDFTKSGFLLPDGTLLDLFDNYYRKLNHSLIQKIYPHTVNGIDAINNFINLGAIRLSKGSIEIHSKPTSSQISVLEKYISFYFDDGIRLDILSSKDAAFLSNVYPENTEPKKIIKDVESTFSGKSLYVSKMNEFRGESIENKSQDKVIELLNRVIEKCEPIKYQDFNSKIFEKEEGSLEKLEKEIPELGIIKNDGSKIGISTLSIIATITDILYGKRLAFILDDNDIITGCKWNKEVNEPIIESVEDNKINWDKIPDEDLEKTIDGEIRARQESEPIDYLKRFLKISRGLAFATQDDSWGEFEKEFTIIIRNYILNTRKLKKIQALVDTETTFTGLQEGLKKLLSDGDE